MDFPEGGRWPIHVQVRLVNLVKIGEIGEIGQVHLNKSCFQISHYAGISNKRLERIGIGGRLAPKKPTLEDIDQSRLQIFRPSMFGGTLQVKCSFCLLLAYFCISLLYFFGGVIYKRKLCRRSLRSRRIGSPAGNCPGSSPLSPTRCRLFFTSHIATIIIFTIFTINQIIALNGLATEGIFRIPADFDEVLVA